MLSQSWGHQPVHCLLSSVCFFYVAQFPDRLWQEVLLHFCIYGAWHTHAP